MDLDYVERFFKRLTEQDGCKLFHNVTYHDYTYNPDANALAVYQMRQIVEKAAPGLVMRQGENGAPSVGNAGGALFDYDWTEISQAKWDVRRMLDNLGHDIECSVFSIVELQYTGNGPIRTKNTKGLLASRADNTVVRPKIAYYAVQHVTSIFDDSLERLEDMGYTNNIQSGIKNTYTYNSDRSIAVYGYQQKGSKKRLYTIWRDEEIPRNDCVLTCQDFAFANSHFDNPIIVDIITGNVYEIPADRWYVEDKVAYFRKIPVYDAPILIADTSLIPIEYD
jgi:hypothetical protein